jgi:hypothetical protein
MHQSCKVFPPPLSHIIHHISLPPCLPSSSPCTFLTMAWSPPSKQGEQQTNKENLDIEISPRLLLPHISKKKKYPARLSSPATFPNQLDVAVSLLRPFARAEPAARPIVCASRLVISTTANASYTAQLEEARRRCIAVTVAMRR